MGVQMFLWFYFCFLCSISRSKIYGSCENELLSYTTLKDWKIKKKKHMIISLDAENMFDYIQHFSNIKTHSDLGIEEMYFKIKTYMTVQCSWVWLFRHVWFFATHGLRHTRPPCPSPIMFIESLMPSKQLILCHPLLLPHSVFTGITVFTSESLLCMEWPKYWSFSFSISPSNDYSGRISTRMYWLDLLPVQGTLKRHLQHHSSKASILQHSAFFIVQLSHLYVTTGKTIALTRWSFVGKVMPLLFNMLSRLVITFNFMAGVTICSDFGAAKN